MKTFADFPEYGAAYDVVKKVEAELAKERKRHAEVESKLMTIKEIKHVSALAAFQADDNSATVDRESLLAEFRISAKTEKTFCPKLSTKVDATPSRARICFA